MPDRRAGRYPPRGRCRQQPLASNSIAWLCPCAHRGRYTHCHSATQSNHLAPYSRARLDALIRGTLLRSVYQCATVAPGGAAAIPARSAPRRAAALKLQLAPVCPLIRADASQATASVTGPVCRRAPARFAEALARATPDGDSHVRACSQTAALGPAGSVPKYRRLVCGCAMN